MFRDRPRKRPVFFFIACLFFAAVPGFCADGYVEGLIQHALELKLDRNPEWLNLVHYRPGLSGYKSLVDDTRFFLAPNGKFDPRAEMAADLAAFFEPVGTNENEHAVCRFVARFAWLDDQLHFDAGKLPMTECALFKKVYESLEADSVALVYPAAFMNGPASMFGHTLLVVDSKEKNRLLSRAISYAAKTRPMVGPLFTFAGIFGLFPGYYAYQSYYEKVEQYGDIGHRDVWEYELDFNGEEVDRLLRHAWELQNIYSRYYFFDENCAFNLLYMLDVARPSLRLTDDKAWFVIPIDTIKLVAEKGIVRSVEYRPSPVTKMNHLAGLVDRPLRELAVDIAHGKKSPADVAAVAPDVADQRVTLGLAAEYTQFLFTEEKLTKADYTPRFLGTLRELSKLGKSDDVTQTIPVPPRPDLGHSPLKLSAGVGVQNDDAFASLRYRIAYHALMDNDAGYTPGAEIQFLHTEARYYFERDALELQQFDIVDVFSVAPRSDLFHPSSWKARVGMSQADFEEGDDGPLYQLSGGTGFAYASRLFDMWYAMADVDAHVADHYEADYAIGFGPSLGVITTLGERWKNLVLAKASYFGIGDDLWRISASWGQDYRLAPDCSISLELFHAVNDGHDINEAQARLNLYF